MAGLVTWIVLVVVTGAICVAVISAIRRLMRELLEANSYIFPAKKFYLRAFVVLVFLAALATISKTDIPSNEKEFLECVWWVAEAAQPLFMALSLWLIGYAALLTLLLMTLGRYRD